MADPGGAGAPKNLNASLFATPDPSSPFPEVAVGRPDLGPPWTGVCFSGGGSRALTAEMGQLRGLASLGLLPSIGWMSTVSGGTWAGTLWNWAPSTIDDATLLGPVELDPAKLEWESGPPGRNLSILDRHAIGSAATRLGIEEMLEQAKHLYEHGTPISEVWPRAIGKLVLEPFGLGDDPARYFTWTPWWLDHQILPFNRGLTAADFVVTRPDRPYLITNSTLFYPPNPPSLPRRPGALASPWEVGYEFETTPMSAGVPPPFPLAGPPQPGHPGSSDLGGGWIDPFAVGSVAPTTFSSERRFTVPTPPLRFRLSDAAGLSSLAYAYDVLDAAHKIGIHYLDDMIPTVQVWPVLRAAQLPRNAARPYLFGDGGNLENQGIMPLLRRRLLTILAFVNTETKLSRQGPAQEVVVDSDLAALFGVEWSSSKQTYVEISPSSPFRFNRVFDRATFDDLRSKLWASAAAGGPAVAVQTGARVYANAHFGVADGTTTIAWSYLNTTPAWSDHLSDWVKAGMIAEFWKYDTFPNYSTVEQLHLDERQVNLLAHLACWSVTKAFANGLPAAGGAVA